MEIRVVRGNITAADVDVIVTAANASLIGGGGVDGAVHRAAGPALLQALRPLSPCPPGGAVVTPAFGLGRALAISFTLRAPATAWMSRHPSCLHLPTKPAWPCATKSVPTAWRFLLSPPAPSAIGFSRHVR
jgi:hypothetical protein